VNNIIDTVPPHPAPRALREAARRGGGGGGRGGGDARRSRRAAQIWNVGKCDKIATAWVGVNGPLCDGVVNDLNAVWGGLFMLLWFSFLTLVPTAPAGAAPHAPAPAPAPGGSRLHSAASVPPGALMQAPRRAARQITTCHGTKVLFQKREGEYKEAEARAPPPAKRAARMLRGAGGVHAPGSSAPRSRGVRARPLLSAFWLLIRSNQSLFPAVTLALDWIKSISLPGRHFGS
jgi:hypothetical protein